MRSPSALKRSLSALKRSPALNSSSFLYLGEVSFHLEEISVLVAQTRGGRGPKEIRRVPIFGPWIAGPVPSPEIRSTDHSGSPLPSPLEIDRDIGVRGEYVAW